DDELCHPPGRPHVAAEPIGFRSPSEKCRQLRPLLDTLSGCRPGRRMPHKRLHSAFLASALEPLAHRPLTHPQRPGDILLRPSFLLQGPGALAPLLAPVGLSRCSHTESLPRIYFCLPRSVSVWKGDQGVLAAKRASMRRLMAVDTMAVLVS